MDKTIEELQAENLALKESVSTLTGERDALKNELEGTKKSLGDSRDLNAKLYLRLSSNPGPVKEEGEQATRLNLAEEINNYIKK